MITKIIDNFTGALTRKVNGDMNSGLAKYDTSFGYDPFSSPGNLTWLEQPTSILTTVSSTVGGVVAVARPRNESGVQYVYAVLSGSTPSSIATLYKIQVNNTTTPNPNFDSPSVIGGLTVNSPALRYGGGMEFYGATEKIFIGHESGVAKINFNGSGNTNLTFPPSSVFSDNRPLANFLGKIYFGNGNNIGEIDSTELVTSYAKLSPGFPSGTYVRDLDVTPDGNYLQITVSRLAASDIWGNSIEVSNLASVDSYRFLWNGTDTGFTSFEIRNGLALVANATFGNRNFTLGSDISGVGLYNSFDKIFTLVKSLLPNFSAVFSTSNMLGIATPEYDEVSDSLKTGIFFYGQYDLEVQHGLFRLLRQAAQIGSDVVSVPACLPVSNQNFVPNFYGYANNVGGVAKLYYSTAEINQAAPLTQTFKLWKFNTVPTGTVSVLGGVWESQSEPYSKKVRPAEFRLYTKPLVANNEFRVELIGSSGNSVLGGSRTFTVHASSIQAGVDYIWWNPSVAPGHSWGTRITNMGSANWTGIKLELDFAEAGK